ncbi:hypothetical protein HK098_003280 [Nowakowskiella sp. JEL0407]|nr:hypothetical protein HK098_003280 [Nowakowskiella sp. JEL0407]
MNRGTTFIPTGMPLQQMQGHPMRPPVNQPPPQFVYYARPPPGSNASFGSPVPQTHDEQRRYYEEMLANSNPILQRNPSVQQQFIPQRSPQPILTQPYNGQVPYSTSPYSQHEVPRSINSISSQSPEDPQIQIRQLEQIIAEKDKIIADQQKAIDNDDIVKALKSELSAAIPEIAQLKQTVEEVQEENIMLLSQIENVDDRSSIAGKSDYDQVSQSRADLFAAKKALEELKNGYTKDKQDLELKLANALEENRKMNEDVVSLRNEFDELKRASENSTEMDALTSQLAAASLKIKELETANSTTPDIMVEMEEKIKTLELTIETLSAESQNANAKVASLTNQLQDAEIRLSAQSAEAFKAELEESKANLASLQTEHNKLLADVAAERKELQLCRRRVEALESHDKETRRVYNVMKGIIEQERGYNSGLRADLTKMINDIENLKTEKASLENELIRLRQ